ncbi:MAG: hypothetical protein FJW36_08175 [Acidobacteria bacterium]|nr:hypothetical protein [Acidobacteriota bacterium]
MSRSKTSPNPARRQDVQKELNRLHRRRLALINLIRSVEEYLLVADSSDSLLSGVPRKPNLKVVYTRAIKEMMA